MTPCAAPTPFDIARLPKIRFTAGAIKQLPDLVKGYGNRALVITGAQSFLGNAHWMALVADFKRLNISWQQHSIPGEPSPDMIDSIVRAHYFTTIDVVIGIGGGSALDAAKAIAGLLQTGASVRDYLEGVGPELPYQGPATPWIAVPTTAGTGSEATKNAVLSEGGANGFKKSFRDEQLVAEWALIDPELLASCPPPIIAANGMDALTQLLESYVSLRANVFTDVLAQDGLLRVRDSLLPWFTRANAAPFRTEETSDARANMAYAALLSGITLAQVGLGSVHGLAAPLGAFFPIPHGIACGTLVAEATRLNILALQERASASSALHRYAEAGRWLAQNETLRDSDAQHALVGILEQWTTELGIPRLKHFGVTEADVDRIVRNSRGSSMKTNPIELTDHEIATVVRSRL